MNLTLAILFAFPVLALLIALALHLGTLNPHLSLPRMAGIRQGLAVLLVALGNRLSPQAIIVPTGVVAGNVQAI